MTGRGFPAALARILVAATLLLVGLGLGARPAAVQAASLPQWTGGIDLYRSGAFSTQQTWRWCTAADVQIIDNIVDHRADHSRAGQARYYAFMRAHNRYPIPPADGVDPAGWTAGLRRFVDARYRLVASNSFSAALRSAVISLRRTNLPVAITVARGNHAWVLTGFTATADPLRTTRFAITSLRVVGPLWGLQSRTYGYDMRPDRKLTPAQLRTFFTPWHYAGIRMAWEGSWVSVQPIGKPPTPPKPDAKVPSVPRAAVATSTPTPSSEPSPEAASASPADPVTAVGGAPTPDPAVIQASPTSASVPGVEDLAPLVLGGAAVALAGLLLVAALTARRRPRPRAPRVP